MKGKHIRKEKKSIVWILIALFVLIKAQHFCEQPKLPLLI